EARVLQSLVKPKQAPPQVLGSFEVLQDSRDQPGLSPPLRVAEYDDGIDTVDRAGAGDCSQFYRLLSQRVMLLEDGVRKSDSEPSTRECQGCGRILCRLETPLNLSRLVEFAPSEASDVLTRISWGVPLRRGPAY